MEGKQPQGHDRVRAGARAAPWIGAPGRQGSWRLHAGLAAEAGRDALGRLVGLETDRRSWFNWLPVAFGLGIGAYFAADREPLAWGPPAALLAAAAAAWALRRRPVAAALALALAALFGGLWAAQLRTERVRAPTLERVIIGEVSGFVEAVDERSADQRLVLLVTGVPPLERATLPQRVRVTLGKDRVDAGEHIRLRARLMPPPEAARPGGYDFARDAFFRGIGAIGSGLGRIERVPAPEPAPLVVRANAAIDQARNAMTERIAALIGGQAGAVAAALVTGKRGLISEETNDVLRGAGIYHIVSISGLHMVLAAGAVFWLVRAALALVPAAALLWPLKKIAAVAAMVGASFYCIFSGSEVATERSLIMTLIMLGAILADRPALSMRNLALAALVVLALEPDALLGPSFQMSFGAVAALIAFAEWDRGRARANAVEPGLLPRLLRGARLATLGLLVTSIIAGAATAPFGAFHFQTYNPYGLIGNMLALPFVSLVVMPAAVAGALLYPLGLDALAWWVMGAATEPVLAVSRHVAALGGSTKVVPAYGLAAILLMGTGLLFLTLLSTSLRWLGLAPLAIGIGLAARPDRADIFIDREGAGVAVRAASGSLAVIGRPGNFVTAQWLKADGDERRPDDASVKPASACDGLGCVMRLPSGRAVAWSRDPATIAEDCGRADLVVTPLRWRGACAALLVDRVTLDRFGAISVRDEPGGLRARSAREPEAPRPWTRRTTPPAPLTAAPQRNAPQQPSATVEDDPSSASPD